MLSVTYDQGAELPDLTIVWNDNAGVLIPFATGWTFELKLGQPGAAAALTKTTGITGADTSPNVTIIWSAAAELNTITPTAYTAQLTATRTSDSKQRRMKFNLTVNPAVL